MASEKILCECCGFRECDSRIEPTVTVAGLRDLIGAAYSSICWQESAASFPYNVQRSWPGKLSELFGQRIRARRASLASSKFYGTMPDPLPKTLPAGTKVTNGQFGYAKGELHLVGEIYDGQWQCGGTMRYGAAHYSVIDWASVPVQAEPACVDCGGPEHDWNHVDKSGVITTSLCHPCGMKRQAKEAARDTIPVPPSETLADGDQLRNTIYVGWDGAHSPGIGSVTIKLDQLCRECSRPERPVAATHPTDLCAYCAERLSPLSESVKADRTEDIQENVAARARLAAADRKTKPRATAESRMLALPHPWSCDENEP